MSLSQLLKPNNMRLYINDLEAVTINDNVVPDLSTVVTDSSDMTLSSGFLMVGNSGLDIKQSLIDASSDNLVFPTNKYVQVDEIKSLVGDAVTISADTNLNLNGSQILTNCDLKIDTTKKLYTDIILDTNNGGTLNVDANIDIINNHTLKINGAQLSDDLLNVTCLTNDISSSLKMNGVQLSDASRNVACLTNDISSSLLMNGVQLSDASRNISTGTATGTALNYNSITSNAGQDLVINSVANKDILIDALGTTGKIKFNTIQNSGVIFQTDAQYPIYVTKDINNYNSLVLAVNSVAPYVAFLGCTRENVDTKPLRLSFENRSVVIADNTTADALFVHALEVNGSVNLRNGSGGSLYVGGGLVPVIDSNKNIISASINCKEISSWINQSVICPATLSGIYLCVPSGVTLLKQFDILVSLSGSDGTAIFSVYDSASVLLFSVQTSTNAITQRLSQSGSYSISGFVELRITWSGATVGTSTIASTIMSVL